MKHHPFTPGNLIVNRNWHAAMRHAAMHDVRLVIKEIDEPRDGYSVVLTVGDNGKLQKDWLFIDTWKVIG